MISQKIKTQGKVNHWIFDDTEFKKLHCIYLLI
jgi:hypothetical protein